MWHIPSHHSCLGRNVQCDLEGHDKCTAINCWESPSSMISQHFIHVRVVALNTVYSNASYYMSNPPETSKFHSENSSYPPLLIQCPANCPRQYRWPIQIYWPSRQSVFPDLCQRDQRWHQHWDLHLVPTPPTWITLNKSTTFPISIFLIFIIEGVEKMIPRVPSSSSCQWSMCCSC